MAINSFSTLKNAVADWLDRDDMGSAIENMIGLMEARLYSQLRVRGNLKFESHEFTAIDGTAAHSIPTDWLEGHRFVARTAEGADSWNLLEWITQGSKRRADNRSTRGLPRYVGLGAANFNYTPAPALNTYIAGHYYYRLESLGPTNETNFLTADWPDLLLYGTLVHSAAYLGNDQRMSLWNTAYDDALKRLNEAESMQIIPRQSPPQMILA